MIGYASGSDQGGTMYNVYEKTSIDLTFPISFADMGYTALGLSAATNPVGMTKTSASACKFAKNANLGSIFFWLAAGH